MIDSLLHQASTSLRTNFENTRRFDSLFLQTHAITRMSGGPIGPHLPAYVAFLQQRQYSTETIKSNLLSASAFSQWLHERHTSLSQLSDETLEIYRYSFDSDAFDFSQSDMQGLRPRRRS